MFPFLVAKHETPIKKAHSTGQKHYDLILGYPDCDYHFLVAYQLDTINKVTHLVGIYPQSTAKVELPEILKTHYPDFGEEYRQAAVAEANQLNPLCGMGYRKALETLTKHHLKDNYKDIKLNVEEAKFSQCYAELNEIERNLARAAPWLGNDYSHLEDKHPNYTVSDLKNYINALALFVSGYLVSD